MNKRNLGKDRHRRAISIDEEVEALVEGWMNHLSIADKVGQMSQIDLPALLKDDDDSGSSRHRKVLDEEKVQYYIGQRGIGSVLNTVPEVPWNVTDYREAVALIQRVAREHQRPLVLYGLDSVHGANYIHGAIWTPQPINIAATFNESFAWQAGQIAARDTMAAGIPWLFSPLVGITWSSKWARVYETFGEDPYLVGVMARAMIEGIQSLDNIGTSTDRSTIKSSYGGIPFISSASACAKHFIGYSLPRNGHDRSPSWIPTRHLYQYFVPSWKMAIHGTSSNSDAIIDDLGKRPVDTIMESYTETDGVPNVANRDTTQYLLRQRLEFEGVLVTDYNEIRNLYEWHRIVSSYRETAVTSLRESSVDISMIPYEVDDFIVPILGDDTFNGALDTHQLSLDRIDESVRRILFLKAKLNLLPPMGDTSVLPNDGELHNDPRVKLVGSDVDTVLTMAHQSIILVENHNSTLPIIARQPPFRNRFLSDLNNSKGIIAKQQSFDNNTIPFTPIVRADQESRIKILVTGPAANSLRVQAGGWSGQWYVLQCIFIIMHHCT
jgi:beta-glucosidase